MRVLELGCGECMTIAEGWEHLDLRPLPHIEHVRSATDLSCFRDGVFDKVIAQDLIEHLGWREIRPTLREWLRVVVKGGTLEIETPCAWELVQILVDPHNPDGRRSADEGDFEFFNRTAFGHQDYPENAHRSYFTESWLRQLLLEAGASSVTLLFGDIWRFRVEAVK